jgi:hypothetical protein
MTVRIDHSFLRFSHLESGVWHQNKVIEGYDFCAEFNLAVERGQTNGAPPPGLRSLTTATCGARAFFGIADA